MLKGLLSKILPFLSPKQSTAPDTVGQTQEVARQTPVQEPVTAPAPPPTPQIDTSTITVPQNYQTQSSSNQSTLTVDSKLQAKFSSQPFNETVSRQPYQGPKPMVVLVLDGWGIGPDYAGNAITLAKTPNLDNFWISFPHTQLTASGQAVGLPEGEDGNTETGHLNIGAGTIVYQELPRINNSIRQGDFNKNQAFHNAFNHVRQHNSNLHLFGLIGTGNVHANIEHLFALLELCRKENITNVYIHTFTDGRDSPPTDGISYLKQIQNKCNKLGIGKIATIMGRFYAMDRDKKWDRIEKAYDAMVVGTKNQFYDPIEVLQKSYDQNVTDEFIEPANILNEDGSLRLVKDNDAVIFFNYRVDRPRELTRAFVMQDFEEGVKKEDYDPFYEKYHKTSLQETEHKVSLKTFQRKKIINNLFFVTMTTYENILPCDVAFAMQDIPHHIGKTLSNHGIRQLRITETEKEKFVTSFLNGKIKQAHPGEDWIIYPSKGVKSYDSVPEMSAFEISNEIIRQMQTNTYDIIIANICNGDMVGHTGNLEAAIKACQIVDQAVSNIAKAVLAKNGLLIITADHGNVEEMINLETGAVDTKHSTFPVPFIVMANQLKNNPQMLPTGILADISPTVLGLMNISKPEGMTGRSLYKF
ncbi:MAG: 2,3-bisphosphoglycerate-independent phosphoglycerate mutase [Candidatus Woesebacteria bacterium]|jgi:2,3-bisphosphoglycerate-independent phosphoglycerate mutase